MISEVINSNGLSRLKRDVLQNLIKNESDFVNIGQNFMNISIRLSDYLMRLINDDISGMQYQGKQQIKRLVQQQLFNTNFIAGGNEQFFQVQKPKINEMYFQTIQYLEDQWQTQNRNYEQMSVVQLNGQDQQIDVEYIQQGDVDYIDDENNSYVADFVSKRFRLIRVEERGLNVVVGSSNNSQNARLISLLRFFALQIMPNDVQTSRTRQGIDRVNNFIDNLMEGLQLQIAQSFCNQPFKRYQRGVQGGMRPLLEVDSNRLRLPQDLSLQYYLSIDQVLSDMGISSQSFLFVYTFTNLIMNQFQQRYQQYLLLLSLQTCQLLRHEFSTQIQPNDEIFQRLFNIEINQRVGLNMLIQYNDQMEETEREMNNLNPRIDMNAMTVRPIFEMSDLFTPILEQKYLLSDDIVNDVVNEQQMRRRIFSVQNVINESGWSDPRVQDVLEEVGENTSSMFDQSIMNLYQQFYDKWDQIQNKEQFIRADLIIDIVVSYKNDDYKQMREQQVSALADVRQQNLQPIYQYVTIRQVFKIVPQEGRIIGRQVFLHEMKNKVISEFFQTIHNYQVDEHGDSEIVAELTQLMSFNAKFERITMKPLIWYSKVQNQINATRLTRARQQHMNQLPNILQMRYLNGFNSYLEYCIDQIFVHKEFEEFRKQLKEMNEDQNCVKDVILFLTAYLDEREQISEAIVNKEFDCSQNKNIIEFQLLLHLQEFKFDYETLRAFIDLFKVKCDIIEINAENILIQDLQPNNGKFKAAIIDRHIFIIDSQLLNSEYIKYALQNYKKKSPQQIRQYLMKNEKVQCNLPNLEISSEREHYRLFQTKMEDIYQLKKNKKYGEAFIFKKCKMDKLVYFDFETTKVDSLKFFTKNLSKNEEARDQIAFCVSYLFDIDFRVKEYVRLLRLTKIPELNGIDENSGGFEDIVLQHQSAQIIFELFCEKQLLLILLQTQQRIQAQVSKVNEWIYKIKDEHMMRALELDSFITAMSYNGAKFDNQFIFRAAKLMFPKDWTHRVRVTGDFSNMKILQVGYIRFLDLYLMSGAGCSLKQFGLSLGCKVSKLQIDKEVFLHYKTVLENKDKIIEYCIVDTDLLKEAFHKFRDTMCNIVDLFCQQVNANKANNNFDSDADDLLDEFIDEMESVKISRIEYYRVYFNIWSTISSLALKIFKQFFLFYYIEGIKDKKVYQDFKNSYFGGFTQAFWLGENFKNEEVHYLDFNSMYPSIMSSLKFPTNYSFANRKGGFHLNTIQNLQEYMDYLKIPYVDSCKSDPLQKNANGFFELQYRLYDYDLFIVTAFKFKDGTFSPSIPVRSKMYGNVYPLEFDCAVENKDIMEQIKDGIPLFGFNIRKLFIDKTLEYIIIQRRVYTANEKGLEPIFREYDQFLYNMRLLYKKKAQINPDEAVIPQCIKILLNSLYGKFGQSFFPIQFIVNEHQYKDSNVLLDLIMEQIQNNNQVDMSAIFKDDFDNNAQLKKEFLNMNIDIKEVKDFIKQESEYFMVSIEDAPSNYNGPGSLVPYASLITVMGRLLINDAINKALQFQENSIQSDGPRVYYCDTDSVIVNQKGFDNLVQAGIKIDNSELGALKSEYPKDKITEIRIINKKVYMYKIKGEWNIKFKGVAKPSAEMYENIKKNGVFQPKQTRFIRDFGNVTIVEQIQQIMTRFPRRLVNKKNTDIDYNATDGNSSQPFNSLSELINTYKDKSGVKFDDNQNNWVIF